MENLSAGRVVFLEPGMIVRHPACPDWGTGQVQSVIGARVTVTFEHVGKQIVDARLALLERVFDPN